MNGLLTGLAGVMALCGALIFNNVTDAETLIISGGGTILGMAIIIWLQMFAQDQ